MKFNSKNEKNKTKYVCLDFLPAREPKRLATPVL